MKELIASKTFVPNHQAPTKVSDLIALLQSIQASYGDIPIELCTHTPTGVTSYQDIFYAYNTFEDGTKNISIQSFPY